MGCYLSALRTRPTSSVPRIRIPICSPIGAANLDETTLRNLEKNARLHHDPSRSNLKWSARPASVSRLTSKTCARQTSESRLTPKVCTILASKSRSVPKSAARQTLESRLTPKTCARQALESRSAPKTCATPESDSRSIPKLCARQTSESRSTPDDLVRRIQVWRLLDLLFLRWWQLRYWAAEDPEKYGKYDPPTPDEESP